MMAACRKPACAAQATTGSAYCTPHKGEGPNLTLPPVPAAVAVKQALVHSRLPPPPPPPPPSPTMIKPGPPPLPGHGHHRRGAIDIPVVPPLAGQGHRRRGAVDFGAASLVGQGQNIERMRVAHASHLSQKKTDREYIEPINAAFAEIAQTPGFARCMDDQIGWTNWSSWFEWTIRSIAPEMGQRPVVEELRDQLRAKALQAGVGGKMFLDRYFFELSLYCDAAIEKMDISFIFGQASMIFGPLLAPLMAVPAVAAKAAGGALAGTATSGVLSAGKALAGVGIKAGLKAGLTESMTQKTTKKFDNVDPMRFTMAWLNFVTTSREPAGPIALIHAEFGGQRGCQSLLDWLRSCNV